MVEPHPHHNNESRRRLSVDRRGASFLVPLGIGAVFVALALRWVSMAGHEDRSNPGIS
jgi:hypothetical protein